MASSPPPIDEDTPYSTPRFQPNRQTLSSPSHSCYSSSSSSFSFNDESPPFSPTNPLKGIPFSWEQVPGIPKNQHFKIKEPSSAHLLLPLPPAGKKLQGVDQEISPKKHHAGNRFQINEHDPFLAALLECSKDDQGGQNNIWKVSSKVSRSVSERFGFVSMYTSCKRTCAVSESIVYLPRQTPSPHYLLNRRS